MNAQLQSGAEPMPPKKQRMTAKRLQEILREHYWRGHAEGVITGGRDANNAHDKHKLTSALWNFFAGTAFGWVMIAPAAHWTWNAFLTFVAAHVH